MVQKLTVESKREAANSKKSEDQAAMTSSSLGIKEEGKQADQQRTLMQLSDNFASNPKIRELIDN